MVHRDILRESVIWRLCLCENDWKIASLPKFGQHPDRTLHQTVSKKIYAKFMASETPVPGHLVPCFWACDDTEYYGDGNMWRDAQLI